MFATIFFKRKDKKPISQAQWKQAQEQATMLDNLLLQDYNDILDLSGGKWMNRVDGTFKSLARIQSPLELRPDGSLSFCFEIRIGESDDGIVWSPRKLKTWLGHDLDYCEIKEDGSLDHEFLYKLTIEVPKAVI